MKILKYLFVISLFVFPIFNTRAQESSLEPIILVPGIMGSWNWETMLQKDDLGNWNFFPLDHTWNNMIDALENAGYEKDVTLFIAFYDWRQSNINSATDYLIPTIDKALLNSPTGKVDIIAHSMGGLMARRYIQSDDYRNDVDQFVMLGTPNYGSSDVYTLWEGGFIPENWGTSEEVGIKIYLWYITTATAQTIDNYDTVHSFIPSIRELLPVYDFLIDSESEGSTKSYHSLVEAKNTFLEYLNFSGTGLALQNLGGITVIAGKGEGTVGNIPVLPRPDSETKLWVDGIPEPLTPIRNDTNGDNRVLLDSAFISDLVFPEQPAQNFLQRLFAQIFPAVYAQFEGDIDEFLKQVEIDSKHGDLPTTAIPEVFTALSLAQPTIAYIPPVEPDNITSFWFASPVEVKITDPQERIVTKDTNEIPGAIYTGESDPNGVKIVIIPDGLPGQYKIELTGTANGEYHMAVAGFTDSADNIVTTEKDVVEGEKIEYTATIDPQSPGLPIEISEPAIIEPGVEKSAIELTDDLIKDLKEYYESGQISDKKIHQSLFSDLKIILAALKEAEITRPVGEKYPKLHELKVKLAKKLAIIKLNSFISKVETQSNKGKIDPLAALDMIAKTEAIIAKVGP